MSKTTTALLAMLTMLTLLPSVSADHNASHECTEADPCNDNDTGCEAFLGVSCTYDAHSQCTSGEGSDGTNSKFCRHDTRDCMVTFDDHCYWHGSFQPRLFR